MFFYLSKFVWFLLQPSALLVILLGIGALATRRRRSRWGLRLIMLSALGLAVGGFSPLGHWLTLPLEQRFPEPRIEALDPVDGIPVAGIIVLGGALDTIVSRGRGVPALNEAGERMTEAVWLASKLPDARLIFSGGSAVIISATMSESAAAAQLFSRMGIAPGRAEFENTSRTTFENALRVREFIQSNQADGQATTKPARVPGRWVLVTSAWHLPRAVGSFRSAGFDVIAWPVDYRTRGNDDLWRGFSRPSEGLQRIDIMSKEWVGLLGYWLLGRTGALLPGP